MTGAQRAALGHEDEAERRSEIAWNFLRGADGSLRDWRTYHPELPAPARS